MHQITVSNITIDVVRKDIKNMHLGVYPPAGRVRIAAPLNVNDDAIRLFAISKLGWIKRQQKKFESQQRITPREFKERESHYFQGHRYLLRIKETTGHGHVDLKGKTYLDLYVPEGATLATKRRILNNWYRREMKKRIPEMLAYWEQKIGVKVNHLGIKIMKTKWGSCNIEDKRVWLNLELMKKPVHCMEYILVHELVHLLERHHNDKFRAYMDHYLPNWKQTKDELNKLPASHADWEY